MKSLLIPFVCVSAVFLIIDVLWLSIAVKSFYRPHLGSLLNDKPVMWAAILFYLIYVFGLTILILRPAIINDSIFQGFWTGILFGIVAYGTYNLTNMATIKNWSSTVAIVDMIWGGLLTGTASAIALYLNKLFNN